MRRPQRSREADQESRPPAYIHKARDFVRRDVLGKRTAILAYRIEHDAVRARALGRFHGVESWHGVCEKDKDQPGFELEISQPCKTAMRVAARHQPELHVVDA